MKTPYLVLFACLPLLAACHRDTRPEWTQAEPAAHLKIPADVDSPGRSAEMVVPGADSTAGEVDKTTLPPVSVTLNSDVDVAATWQLISAKLASDDLGSVVNRDDAGRQVALSIKGSALPDHRDGMWDRMWHDGPDVTRDYLASVGVSSQNGETLVSVDGDGRAVLYLDQLLQGGAIRDSSAGDKGITVDVPRVINSLPTNSGGLDASGRPADR